MLTLASVALLLFTQAQNGSTCDPAKEKVTKKNSKPTKGNAYGAVITKDGAMDVKQLPQEMADQKEVKVKIKGTITAACQVKGCWMTADLGDGKTMRIRFKDYAFFVPKDSGGKTFYAEGVASWSITSVAQLKHYAEDAGKSKAEIDKITEDKKEIVFLADGVIIEKN
ncbi:MAG: DUF4920 domain-containing protein [Bacteroidetes bacterium]|nr:DUF4920 domain-containing protein [Bacteroidota bacterium]